MKHYRQFIRPLMFAADKVATASRARRRLSYRVEKNMQQKTELINVWEGEGGSTASLHHRHGAKGYGVFVNSDYLSFSAGGDWVRNVAMHVQDKSHNAGSAL